MLHLRFKQLHVNGVGDDTLLQEITHLFTPFQFPILRVLVLDDPGQTEVEMKPEQTDLQSGKTSKATKRPSAQSLKLLVGPYGPHLPNPELPHGATCVDFRSVRVVHTRLHHILLIDEAKQSVWEARKSQQHENFTNISIWWWFSYTFYISDVSKILRKFKLFATSPPCAPWGHHLPLMPQNVCQPTQHQHPAPGTWRDVDHRRCHQLPPLALASLRAENCQQEIVRVVATDQTFKHSDSFRHRADEIPNSVNKLCIPFVVLG